MKKTPTLASGKKLTSVLVAVFGWLVIIFVAWFLAKACALALYPSTIPTAPAVSSQKTPIPVMKPGSSLPPFATYSALESNNLFNLNSHAPVMISMTSQAQTLNAILMGTVEAPLLEDARAIIQYQGKQHVLRPGEDIAGFVLKNIKRDLAVFEGKERVVELATTNPGDLRPGGSSAQNRGQPAAATPTSSGQRQTAETQPQNARQKQKAGPSVPLAVASMAVASLSAPELGNALVPNEDASGLVVRQTSGNLILTAMNLKQGDVLTGVNGKPAAIITDSQQMMREIESGSLNVSLLRDGKQENIILNISDLNG